ncbi:hypothetical protein Adt_41873 [Abeliophyllum distichum]|uniref:Uncharacterized protein n=1 Tax=Abeliophyllum distichum TaxID=126358 RepID=A0ABD1PQ25_9LAMI
MSVLLQRRFSENDKDTSMGLDGFKGHLSFPKFDRCNESPRGISNKFSRDPYNDDPRFAVYEAQLHQMERTNQHLTMKLKHGIRGVVPEEDENEDDDGGLGDM